MVAKDWVSGLDQLQLRFYLNKKWRIEDIIICSGFSWFTYNYFSLLSPICHRRVRISCLVYQIIVKGIRDL